MRATFAIPGNLATPSGGYGYARRVLRGAAAAGIELTHLGLPGGYPNPAPADLEETISLASGLPADQPVLIDGLALGAMPGEVVAAFSGPIVALCHHPLALETGVAPDRAADLEATERKALHRASAVVTTSEATAAILCDRFMVPQHKLTIAHPGTDPAPRAAGSGGPGCAVLSVGSVTERKGHRRLIAELAALRDVDWTLRIVGPAPDPVEMAGLGADIDRFDLRGRVTLTGPLSMTAVQAAYQTADLFVLASEYEGFGMVFTEAMANGLPVLGLQSAAVAEATRGAARLVEAPDFPAALSDLVRRPASRVALAEQCWRAAAELPRWDQTVQKIADVLRARAGFSPDWLSLRRDADDRARNGELTGRLVEAVRGRNGRALRVLDLGAGTGANLRALSPHLPIQQNWVLADNDPKLLARVRAPEGVATETVRADVPADLDRLFDRAPDLVTASAFFDLCGPQVTDQIVARVVAAGAIFQTVLTFDGREDWATGTGHDARVHELFLKDQRREKGMGAALGPEATGHLARAFRAAGYTVTVLPSDWVLERPRDADLIAALAQGHAETARVEMGDAADIWLQSARVAPNVLIGHQDLLAVPAR